MHLCSSTYHCLSTHHLSDHFSFKSCLFFRPEVYLKADINPSTGKPLDVGNTGLEPAGNAKKNDGFFAKGVMKAMESPNLSNSVREVKVIGNGHCHGMSFTCLFLPYANYTSYFVVTDNCRLVDGLWFCFGGGG